MAQRRMFSSRVTSSGRFLTMPPSSQNLYFHLGMRADDDGVVEAHTVIKLTDSKPDDYKVLIAKRFIYELNDDLVVVIMDWREHNLIRPDRKIDSIYKELLEEKLPEMKLLEAKQRADRQRDVPGTTNGPHRLGKGRLGKGRLGTTMTPPNPLKGEGSKGLVNYFFVLKGWNDKPKDFYSKNKIIYARFMKPASQILELCDENFEYAKDRIQRVFVWAESRELDWGLETVIKKFLDIDKLTEREKKPTWKGQPMYKRGGKWWVITNNGEHKEFTNKLSEIVYV